MNYEILVWILIVLLIIIGIVLFVEIENLNSKVIKDKTKGKKKLEAILLTIIFVYIATHIPINQNYSLISDKEMFTKFKTPQIDSTMYLAVLNEDRKFYRSINSDTAYHFLKRVDYDLFALDKIIDIIYNRKLETSLELTYVHSSIFRNEKRLYEIIKHVKGQGDYRTYLNEQQKDSVLKAWGFTEQLYIEDNRH